MAVDKTIDKVVNKAIDKAMKYNMQDILIFQTRPHEEMKKTGRPTATGKSLFALILVWTFTLLLAGCGARSDDGKIDVRIAYFPNVTHTQALVLKEMGTLEKQWEDKCNVSWTAFNAGPSEIEALFAGEIDLGYIGPGPAINGYIQSKGDINIIANASDAGAVLVKRKDSDIDSVGDLGGKIVAIPQLGNTQHLCLLHLLSQNGLKPTSSGGTVEVAAVANADVMNMMEQGSIDAALVPEPWGSILEQRCGAQIVLDYDQIFLEGEYPTAVVITSKDFMKQHSDLVLDFLKAHDDATLLINQDKENVVPMINHQMKQATGKSIEEDILKSALQRLNVTTDISKEAIKLFGKIGYDEGFARSEPDDDIVDGSLLLQVKE